VFALALPKDNLFAALALARRFAAGIYPPVDDEIYVRIDQLAGGQHTLQIHAEIQSRLRSGRDLPSQGSAGREN